MTGFSGSPKVFKGALVGLDALKALASVVVFQYNPGKVTRTLQPRTSGGDASAGEALRITGPPEETFTLDIGIDATDQLVVGEAPLVTDQ